ncbi:MAG: TetR/AcrR family transcriptional regulator [Syntrophaceae bacterium]|nr:TetR/AcrR family transcriptional regulator [Syntrophaceae bacterium]
MDHKLEDQISLIISRTRAHKDTFAVPQLIQLLSYELGQAGQDDNLKTETALAFVEKVFGALSGAPIYSDALIREFYRCVLETVESNGIQRNEILEDLLFQSLRRPPHHEPGKRKKQKDARDRILAAALAEFSEKGFHSSTIDSIADRAGIAKGTVYRYFSTKEGLFTALKDDTMSEFVDLAKRRLSGQEDVLEIIESIIKIYLSFFERNSAFFKVIIQEHKDFGREFSEKFTQELIGSLPSLKRRCWKASRLGKLKQMNYYTVFFGIIGFLNGVIQKWLHEGGEGSLVDEIETVREVLFYGFAIRPDEPNTTNILNVIS